MQKNSTAPNNEVFAGLFQKAAGSQGRALRRSPQRAESPFETRCPPRVSTQTNKKRKTVLSDGLSHERTLCAEYCASLGMRFFIFVQLIFAEAKIKKRVSPVATGDSGLCPENPQTFEKV